MLLSALVTRLVYTIGPASLPPTARSSSLPGTLPIFAISCVNIVDVVPGNTLVARIACGSDGEVKAPHLPLYVIDVTLVLANDPRQYVTQLGAGGVPVGGGGIIGYAANRPLYVSNVADH